MKEGIRVILDTFEVTVTSYFGYDGKKNHFKLIHAANISIGNYVSTIYGFHE